AWNERNGGALTVLKAAEVSILEDGSLDLPDALLRELDLTVCSVHDPFGLDEARQTERILRAMDHPCFTILGNPGGRATGDRSAYPLDLERVLRGAAERGCFVEVSARPDRLGLNDEGCRLAKDVGATVAVASGARAASELASVRFGVDRAR